MKKRIIETMLMLIVAVWCVLSLLVLAGEPVEAVGDLQVLLVRVIAFCSFAMSVLVGRILYKYKLISYERTEE